MDMSMFELDIFGNNEYFTEANMTGDLEPDDLSFHVFPSELGGYPHFHFFNKKYPMVVVKGTRKVHGGGCICLEHAAFFVHETHTATLDSDTMEIVVNYLNGLNIKEKYEGNTLWRAIVNQWNNANPDYKVDKDLKTPEYLNGMKIITIGKKK